jgi:regulator of sirC expression with transglutaminase-like and TPR domain
MVVSFLSTFLLLVTLCTTAIASSQGEVYRQAKAATALIVAINDTNHSISLGSGFFVDPNGLLVTNAHVLEEHTRLFVYVQDRHVFPAPQVLAVDEDVDLAAIRIPLKDTGVFLALARHPPEDGEDVIAAGYPRVTDILQMGFVLHPTVVSGHANGVTAGRSRTKGRQTPFIQTTGNFNFGNSGGPLVGLDSQEAHGMVVHTVPYLERAKDRSGTSIGSVIMKSGIGYSIPASVIREWLTKNRLLPAPVAPTKSSVKAAFDPNEEANQSFATGHLLHTLAMVLQEDVELLNLALFHYETAATLMPEAPWIAHNLGLVSASLGRWGPALQAYERALRYSPKDPALLADVALAWERSGNRERAIEFYRAAIQANPRSEVAHNNLGTVYLKMSRYEEAVQEFRRALESNPASGMASYNLGVALEAKGLKEDALLAWETYLHTVGSKVDAAGFNGKMREGVARIKPLIAKAHTVSGIPPR